MTTLGHTEKVDTTATVTYSQGQAPVQNATKSLAQKGILIQTAIIDDESELECAKTVSQHGGPTENTTQHPVNPPQQSPQSPITIYSESMPSVIQRAEDTVAVCAKSSLPGTPQPPQPPLNISAFSLLESYMPYEQVPSSNLSTAKDTVTHQSTPPEISEEARGIADIFSSARFTGANEESNPKGLLKDIFLECPLPHYFNGDLTLVIMRSGNVETLGLTKTSPTKWKAVGNISLHHNGGDMTLILNSKDGGDVAFLTFAGDEIYAMACAEEDIPAVHVFASVKEDDPASIKMISTVASSPILESAIANRLGYSYYLRFRRAGDLQDIDCAISYLQTAVESTPSGHADLQTYCDNLGNSYYCRFQRVGDLQDIGRAISYHHRAVESTPSDHAELPAYCNNLGNSYLRRFERTGDLHDIDCAISHHQSAVKATPALHGDHAFRFNSLGNSYSRRFERTGDLHDIDCAISHHQSAVESTPYGDRNLPTWLSNLGNSYFFRFKRTSDVHDIDCSVSYHLRAVKSTPSSDPELPNWLNNLGGSYSCRFQCTGNLQDIDLAISHLQRAVESYSTSHPNLPGTLNNLGSSYLLRFSHTSDLHDIDRGISYHERAVKSAPYGHANLPRWLNNLGTSYLGRFDHTSDLRDLDHAISYQERAVESAPSGHAQLPGWFLNLGTSYSSRFGCTGHLQDIDHAISYQQRAVGATPSGHTNLPGCFHNLGVSYSFRFESSNDLRDINHAISHHHSAIRCTPPDHAGLSMYWKNLARSYQLRFISTSDFSDFESSISFYRRAAEANGTPSIRLKSASIAATLSSSIDDSRCLIDFALAISLLSEVAGLEQTVHRRHANLHNYPDLVGSAVACALASEKPDLALEWLEQGRCLVWNQLHQLRTPIDSLRMSNPPLADRFIEVASALESYGTRSAISVPHSHVTLADDIRLQDDTRNHTIHATEYKQLLTEIQGLPGFHDFLQPPKAQDLLSSLPPDGPVIIFNIHHTRCDALALLAGIEVPLHIPLEDFSFEQAEQLQKTLQFDVLKQREVENIDRAPRRSAFRNRPSMESVLKELWCKVVQPILEALGYSLESPPSTLDRGRVWWCPTGPLAFLPLHAAGIYGSAYKPGSCISDFVVSSYIPTVRSLNDKFNASSNPSRSTNLVLISQPNTPGLDPIPSTRTETDGLDALMKGTAVDALLLEDSKATRDSVKMVMQSHSWIHFACHGIQDVNQPLESGLCLHDGRLGLLEIMKQQIPNPNFAFLSACQTSKGDLKLSEEVVHLTAGMLAAGYRGVVGTMWSISDMHGPEFAMEFYLYLLKDHASDGLDSTRAAYALDYATRKVREGLPESERAFLTWVPYVHFGY